MPVAASILFAIYEVANAYTPAGYQYPHPCPSDAAPAYGIWLADASAYLSVEIRKAHLHCMSNAMQEYRRGTALFTPLPFVFPHSSDVPCALLTSTGLP